MSLKYIIPNDGMDKLVCSSCNNYLSIFPIYLTTDNSAVICGRCTPFNKDQFIRDEAYEAIAEFLQFPCCYKKNGCEEVLTPHKLEEHEPKCLSRMLECPSKLYSKCNWLGALTDLVGHFEECHLNLLMMNTSEFKWSFGTSIRENLLLPYENEMFVVKKDLDARTQVFCCSVERLAAKSNSIRYNYTIKLFSDDKNYWCKLPEKATEDRENVTVHYEYVRVKLHDPGLVIAQIEIAVTGKIKEQRVETPVDVVKNPNLNWDLLNELECPVCFGIMSNQIYQCTGGHSICRDCKLLIKICPLCRKDVLDTRNYGLEKLTSFLTYPCKFYNVGCPYTSKSDEIKLHEGNCEFGPMECPLKELRDCHEKVNRSRIVEHVESNHSHFILKSNKISRRFVANCTKHTYNLIKFLDKVFLMRYKYDFTQRRFYWTVQLVGSAEECKKFKFDIDIIDNSNRKLRCYLKGFCVPIQEKIKFDDPLKYVMLTYDQLQPFITTTLDYNIHIIAE